MLVPRVRHVDAVACGSCIECLHCRPCIRVSAGLVRAWGAAETAVSMAELTLKNMAAGGIYDHIGGGFARYSVDEWWHVPHFEKM